MSEAKALAALNKLSRQRFSLDGLPEAVAEINASSDRSVAIVLGSLVEDALYTAIMCQMKHLNKEEEKEPFGVYKPLSTFSAKINICYAIKIINRNQKNDAQKVQKIRTAFAHNFLGLSFDLEQVRDVCKLLKYPTGWPAHESWPPRKRFVAKCLDLWLRFGNVARDFVYTEDNELKLLIDDPA